MFLVLAVLALVLHVPYVILSPGPTFNTLGTDQYGQTIIVIKGRTPNTTTGHLNMTTVDVGTGSVTVFQALEGWLASDQIVVPRDSIFPPGQSQQQVNQQNTQDFLTSQDNAEAAAFCELGYPKGLSVQQLSTGSPALGKLQAGDQILTFDGEPAGTDTELTNLLAKASPGAVAVIGIKRNGVPKTVDVRLGKASGRPGALIGIDLVAGCIAPFQVDLGLGNQIGGPSAGLMFALGIIDKVGSVDLTNGAFVAGTGTIDPSGNVGPIGGIQLKMIAARRAGATVFLAPAGNCSDVSGSIPKGLNVIKVDTLSDALTDLADLRQGKPVPHC